MLKAEDIKLTKQPSPLAEDIKGYKLYASERIEIITNTNKPLADNITMADLKDVKESIVYLSLDGITKINKVK